jgi:lysozyme
MRPRLSISRSAVELIKAFEGFRPRAARLDDGRWTIGYGHTLTAREGAEVTERDAEALLLYDLIPIAHAVNEHVYAPMNQNQFDALVSFVFNIGVRNFRGSPTLRRLNEGRPLEGALAMEMWRKSDLDGERIVVDALVRRRSAEKTLFLRPMEGWTAAPSPVLPPRIDYDVASVLPLHTPIATRTPMAGERAFAERAPTPTFEPPETPSASAAAAAAVIERLEAILTDTDTPADAKPAEPVAEPTATEKPAAKPAETPFVMPFTPVVGIKPQRRRRPLNPLVFLVLAAAGVGLCLLAALWGFQLGAAQVFGVPAQTAGLTAGVLGVGCLAVAIYFLLERLGVPRDR